MNKRTDKISMIIFLLGLLYAVCMIPIVFVGLPDFAEACRAENGQLSDWLVIIGRGGVLLGFLFSLLLLLWLSRQIVRPIRLAVEFTDALVSGEFPAHLSERGMRNSIIQNLFAALNLLRDRQQNLNSKLKLSLSHEADVRRGVETHCQLQLRIIGRMLPEMRLPLGSIKGYGRVLMMDLESGQADPAEMHHLLEEIGHRVGILTRQIDRLHDIAALNRAHWSQSEIVEFDTAEFMRELASINQVSLQEREVMLVNHFSASAPELLALDRELLLQLITIMIQAIGRSAAAGETLVFSCLTEEGRVIFEIRDSKHAPLREPLVEPYHEFEESADPEEVTAESQSIPILGLIFAREMADKIGGTLRVTTSPTASAVLRIELFDGCVAKSGEFRHVRGNFNRTELAKSEGEKPKRKITTTVRALHGTENPDSPYVLKRLLGAENIEVHSFSDASELLDEARSGKYDCLILSSALKNCELQSMISELRRAAGHRDLPVVILGNSLPTERLRELTALNKVYQLNIPLNYALLARIIHEMAGSRF